MLYSLEAYVSIFAADVATLRPLFSYRSKKPSRNVDKFSDGKTPLKYTKFSTNTIRLETWPGFNDTTTSNDIEANTDRVRDDEVSLEHMGGIRRVVDVHVSA